MPQLIVMVGLSLIVALFALQNAISVELNFLVFSFRSSLVLVILGSFGCGILVTAMLLLRAKYRHYQECKKLKQQLDSLGQENAKLEERVKMMLYNQKLHHGSTQEQTMATNQAEISRSANSSKE